MAINFIGGGNRSIREKNIDLSQVSLAVVFGAF
jgi:hypothetical protein